jgi:hypothetical protein
MMNLPKELVKEMRAIMRVHAIVRLIGWPVAYIARILLALEQELDRKTVVVARKALATGELDEKSTVLAKLLIGASPDASAQERVDAIMAGIQARKKAEAEKAKFQEDVDKLEAEGEIRKSRKRTVYTTRTED